uniref:Uncharacterized protein n=1 Tax=Sphaerodactylus townsendi TaxID=933632 RepID=A0ACB8F704_9SAUR
MAVIPDLLTWELAMEMKILEAKADAAAAAKQVDFLKRKEEIIEEQAHLKAQEAARQATSSPVESSGRGSSSPVESSGRGSTSK